MGLRLNSGVEIPEEWGPYSTQQAGEFEIVHRPLWDTQTYTDNSTTLLNFFGSQQANVGLGNEIFPLKNSFLCCAIGVYFKHQIFSNNIAADGSAYTGALNDIILLSNTGVLAVTIGQKLYGPFPVWKLTPGAGVWGLLAGAGGTPSGAAPPLANFGQMGMPTPEAMFKLAIPLVLPMSTNIQISMSWASAVNTSTGNVSTCLILDGKEARPLQ